MKIDRRLILLGVMLVVLSMTMATQYATTRVSYSFSVVHPSESDIRFIGSDNSSDDAQRALRVLNNASTSRFVTLELGDWMPDSVNNYTAAFGIVNEEQFYVNITHINVSGTGTSNIDIWLHGDRDQPLSGDGGTKVEMVRAGVAQRTSSDISWTLAPGNGNADNMCADGSTQLNTVWDTTRDVRYSVNNANNSVNITSDFVWVHVSLDIPSSAADAASATGSIHIHFKASDAQ